MAREAQERDQMAGRSDAEILDILTYQHEYRPEAVRAAMWSWEDRKVGPEALVAAQQQMDSHRQVRAQKAAQVARLDRNVRRIWRGIRWAMPPWRRRRRPRL